MTLKAKILLVDAIMWAMLALWMTLLYCGQLGRMMVVGAAMSVPFGLLLHYEQKLREAK